MWIELGGFSSYIYTSGWSNIEEHIFLPGDFWWHSCTLLWLNEAPLIYFGDDEKRERGSQSRNYNKNCVSIKDLFAAGAKDSPFTFIVNDDFCARISTNETAPDFSYEEHWTPLSGLLPSTNTIAMASLHCRLWTLFCRIRITGTHSNRRSPYMRWSLYFKGSFCSKGVLSDPKSLI